MDKFNEEPHSKNSSIKSTIIPDNENMCIVSEEDKNMNNVEKPEIFETYEIAEEKSNGKVVVTEIDNSSEKQEFVYKNEDKCVVSEDTENVYVGSKSCADEMNTSKDMNEQGSMLLEFDKGSTSFKIHETSEEQSRDTAIAAETGNFTEELECVSENDDIDTVSRENEKDDVHKTFADSLNQQNDDQSLIPNLSSAETGQLISSFDLESTLSSSSSSPSSPQERETEDNSYLDITNDNETTRHVRKGKCTLPYFQCPNPDLDEFIKETDKNLQIPETKNTSGFSRKSFVPKDTGDIVFTIESNDLKHDNNEISRNSVANKYEDILSSINKLDDSKSPGIKRLALKKFLQKQIEEKKLATFKRSMELTGMDEENYIEENTLDSDSSEEELFQRETNSLNEQKTDESDEMDESDEIDESDEVIVRKINKKAKVLENESSDEELYATDVAKDLHYERISNVNVVVGNSDLNIEEKIGKKKECVQEDLSVAISLPVESSDDFEFTKWDKSDEDEGIDNSSMIPPYQPYNISHYSEEEKNNYEIDLKYMTSEHEKQSLSQKSNSSFSSALNKSEIEDKTQTSFQSTDDSTPTFGLTLDDPPLSQPENGSAFFSSQELANVCSGVFKSDVSQKMKVDKDIECFLQKEYDEDSCSSGHEMPEQHVQDFFDAEAELSGDDFGVDDDQDVDNEVDDMIVDDDHGLPPEEELRDEIAYLHTKRMQDDDDELLKEIQDKFLDDGDLNNSGRERRFAWKNNDKMEPVNKDRCSSSDSDSDSADENWRSNCKDKVKWLQENEKEEFMEVYSTTKKSQLKINIIGKPGYVKIDEDSQKPLPCKRPRGSFLHLDDGFASQVLKKLKPCDDEADGSKTTKHFVFRNDSDVIAESSKDLNKLETTNSQSVFSKIGI